MAKQSAVERAVRAAADFGDAADVVDQAAADVLGVNRTDLRILGAVYWGGPQSAGQLGREVHLSPAATTEAVQRLVARGFLARGTDAGDRRRAVITLEPATSELIARIYGPVGEAGVELLGSYTVAELGAIAGFLEQGRRLQLAEAERIRGGR